MTTLKLFGCTATARQRLQQTVDMDCCVEGQLEELYEQHQDEANQVWVVYVNAANEFLDAAFDAESHSHLPKAVLWVPQGQQPLPLDDWWEGFAAQLQEERPDDRTMLQRLSRCAQVLEWGERIEDIPQEWFAALTDTAGEFL